MKKSKKKLLSKHSHVDSCKHEKSCCEICERRKHYDNFPSKIAEDHDTSGIKAPTFPDISTDNELSIKDKLFYIYYFKMIDHVISYGKNILQTGVLLNGGAVVSLLAFMGNLLSKNELINVASTLSLPLLSFSIGLIFSFLSFISVYLVEKKVLIKREELFFKNKDDFVMDGLNCYKDMPTIASFIMTVCPIFSFIFFILGIYHSYKSFISFCPYLYINTF